MKRIPYTRVSVRFTFAETITAVMFPQPVNSEDTQLSVEFPEEWVRKLSWIGLLSAASRKCCGNLMVQISVAFPRDGYDGKRVRWKWRHCFVFPQRFRWLKRVSSFPLRFRKRFCTEIRWFSWSIPGFSYNKICFNCTDYASGKMRNHYVDLKYPKEQR